MRVLLFLSSALLISASVLSQNEAGESLARPFPFGVALLSTDSIAGNSDQIFSEKKSPLLLAFWMTTCFPCRLELDAYAKQYPFWKEQNNLRILAISIDFPERFAKIGERVHETNYPFQVWWDATRSFKEILPGRLNGLPQVFLFDSDGNLVWRHKGYRTGDENLITTELNKLK